MKNDTRLADGGLTEVDMGQSLALRQSLRSGTRDRHDWLDARFEGMHLAATPTAYHRFVRMNAVCHELIEPILSASPLIDAFPDWTTRDRASYLARDMSAMCLAPARTPLPARYLTEPDLPEAIGLAYVLEGSRLGGRYIHRLLKARAHEPAWATATFHYLESTDEPDRFRDFVMRSEALLTPGEDVDRAVNAANAAFDIFMETESWLAAANEMTARSAEPSV